MANQSYKITADIHVEASNVESALAKVMRAMYSGRSYHVGVRLHPEVIADNGSKLVRAYDNRLAQKDADKRDAANVQYIEENSAQPGVKIALSVRSMCEQIADGGLTRQQVQRLLAAAGDAVVNDKFVPDAKSRERQRTKGKPGKPGSSR